MAPLSSKPGLLLVHPYLRSPNDSNASTFHRWTKLHFKDLINVPADPSSGAKVDACIRATAPELSHYYSHDVNHTINPAYLYTCFVNDISFVKSQPYYALSRKLNLEHTRPLTGVEQPVGYKDGDKEAMVFDIVDAKFAVYEEINEVSEPEYPSLSSALQTTGKIVPRPSSAALLIRVNVHLPPEHEPLASIVDLRTSLQLECERAFGSCMIYSSAYRWADMVAQPDEHPLIYGTGTATHMILVYVQDTRGTWDSKSLSKVAEKEVGSWANDISRSRFVSESRFHYGAWAAEVFTPEENATVES